MTPLPPVCILAGGLGKRLGMRVRDTPKPLLEVAGQPFLVHQLRLLAEHGAREVVVCVGYRGEQIRERIGSERFGVRIGYSFDAPELDGTLGAVRRAQPRRCPSINRRPMRGWTGSRAMTRPISVIVPPSIAARRH